MTLSDLECLKSTPSESCTISAVAELLVITVSYIVQSSKSFNKQLNMLTKRLSLSSRSMSIEPSDVSVWKDVHDLVFGRHGEVPGKRFVCPTFFNSTESLRSHLYSLINCSLLIELPSCTLLTVTLCC